MTKATHYGECQLCGRKQKLPGGALANHGYTVEWSSFHGICPGSNHEPYELSKDQIDKRIPAILLSCKDQAAMIAVLKAEPLPVDKMMVHVYLNNKYQWVETQVRGESYSVEYLCPPDKSGWGKREARWMRMSGCAGKTAQEYFNDAWVRHLEQGLANTTRYLKWLEDRSAAWVLKECAAVK